MNRYALVIGISDYNYLPRLSKPAADAQAVADRLRKHGNFQDIWLLNKKEEVKHSTLTKRLQTFLTDQAEKSDAVIYFSGHGFTVSGNFNLQDGYLATYDCQVTLSEQTDKKIIQAEKGISLREFNQLIQDSNLSSLIVILDCCHSGYFIEDSIVEKALKTSHSLRDYFVMAACRRFEEAFWIKGHEHSIFTGALLESLLSENADRLGRQISAGLAFDFIYKKLKGTHQEPIFLGWGGSIPLVNYPYIRHPPVDEDEKISPYQGLKPFTESTKDFFFGREKIVWQLIEKLEQTKFVPLIGVSGCGKTSILQAGLIPKLKERGWQILGQIEQEQKILMKPGSAPLAKLKEVFQENFPEYFQDSQAIQQLDNFIDNNSDELPLLSQDRPDSKQFLLVVDQFEEVFTPDTKEKERERFIDLLTQVARIPHSRLTIIIAVRSDFLSSCLSDSSLAGLMEEAVYVTPLVGANLEEAIIKPAKGRGYQWENGLAAHIQHEVGSEEGCLAMLQFALTELWEKRDRHNHLLTREAYKQLGGVTKALNRYADNLYAQRTDEEQEWIRRIFLKLVQTGEGVKDTSKRRDKKELLALAGDDITTQRTLSQLLDELISGPLLVAGTEREDREAWVALVHETLMEEWDKFKQWRGEERELRRLIDKVENALQQWQNNNKNEQYLMREELLTQLEANWEEVASSPLLDWPLVKEFYQASEQAQKWSQLTKASEISQLLLNDPIMGLVRSINAVDSIVNHPQSKVPEALEQSLNEAIEVAREQNILEGHTDEVHSVAVSSDSQYIVSGSQDGTLRLWNPQGALISQPFQGHEKPINSVVFSPKNPKNEYIIVSGSADGTLRLWDLQGNPICQPFREPKGYCVNSVAFSLDGKYIVSGSGNDRGDQGCICLWDRSGNLIGNYKIQDKPINSVAFSPKTSDYIASGGADGLLKIWNCSLDELRSCLVPNTFVNSVAFSPDEQLIASGSADGIIRLWDLQGNKIGESPPRHKEPVMSIAFSSDGEYIISGSADPAMQSWDRKGNPIGQPFKILKGTVRSVAFSPDGQFIVSGSEDRKVRLWDLRSRSVNLPFRGHVTAVNAVAFGLDHQKTIVASGSAGGTSGPTIRLWNLQGTPMNSTFKGHEKAIRSIAFSPKGDRLVSGSDDCTVRLWDLKGKQIGEPLKGHTYAVRSVVFNSQGNRIASGSADGTIRLWDLFGNLLGTLKDHSASLRSIAFSPDDLKIVSGSDDGIIRSWDLSKQPPVSFEFKGHSNSVRAVAFHPHGNCIASGSSDGTIRLWDLQGNLIGQPFRGHEDIVRAVAFHPHGNCIASGSSDGTIRLWDLQGNSIVEPFRAHKDYVRSIAFSPDGKYIVSGSSDKTLQLWNLDGTPVIPPQNTSWEEWLQVACNRLRYHPILNKLDEYPFDNCDNPEDARRFVEDACQICQKSVWSIV